MSKAKRKLELGAPLAAIQSDRMEFAVCAGRWTGGEDPDDYCVVIVQERSRGPLGKSTTFKMAVEPEAVATIREGLDAWLQACSVGSLERMFEQSKAGAG